MCESERTEYAEHISKRQRIVRRMYQLVIFAVSLPLSLLFCE